MSRTRVALLDGARSAVEANGTKITMAQVAAAAGVAKATLYNHFRTRDAVLAALLADEVARLAETCADRPLDEALAVAATTVAQHPVLRSLARLEPATLAVLGCVDLSAEGWQVAHEAVSDCLARAGRGGAETVLRLLASYIVTPAGAAAVAADVDVVLAGLPTASARWATDAALPA
jgi:AcrR family transcriptional regulator